MIYDLNQLTILSIGITLRSPEKPSHTGKIRVIQMRNLRNDNTLDMNGNILHIEHTAVIARQYVCPGDLIFRSRGQNMTAVLLEEDAPSETVISAPLIKITPDQSRILPAYLLWWINNRHSQAYFQTYAEGTALKMISRKTLGNLEIELPSLQRQQDIAGLSALALREQTLLGKLRTKRARHTHGVLMRLLREQTA